MPSQAKIDGLRDRLLVDLPFYAETCLKIVDRRSELVALVPNPAQLRLHAAIESQRLAGVPQRVIVLKARKTGISTWVQAAIVHRITQRPNRRALVVAHDGDTAEELFGIGERMYGHLPQDRALNLKPPIFSQRRGHRLQFGVSPRLRAQGVFGLDSKLEVDTAREVEAGRGYTFTELHLSEVALWRDVSKMVALLNAVPDEPQTLIVIESTAKGHNHFKEFWDDAVNGVSSYVPVFVGWHEDDACWRRFEHPDDRAEFVVGEGPFGEDEPRLVERFGCTLEQLNWRRWAIVNRCLGKLDVFKCEYPSSAEEAFIGTGRQVFSMLYVSQVLDGCELTDPQTPSRERPGPQLGVLAPSGVARKQTRAGLLEVPTGTAWVPSSATAFGPGHRYWRLWERPVPAGDGTPAGRYIVAVDPAEGITDGDTGAWQAIEVIDHRTRLQVAELRTRIDPDLLGLEAFLACLFFNRAWLVIETTGGWGGFMARRIWRDFGYPLVYRRKPVDKTKDKQEDRLGWDTNRTSKVYLVDNAHAMLREGTHGIRSRGVGLEMTTFVEDDRGRMEPAKGQYSDRLMAWMIAQFVANEKPVPSDRPRGAVTATGRGVRYPRVGY